MRTRLPLVTSITLAVLLLGAPTIAAELDLEGAAASSEGLVDLLYEAVTVEPGTTPDWDTVREMFLDDAVIVLRTGREETAVFTVDSWIEDFVSFIDRAGVERTGFVERIVRTHPTTFGDIAHVWVLYEAHIPGDERPPRQGVDSFQLVRRDGRWWIASITNELPSEERPLPPELAG